MRLAEHFAVGAVCCATLAPCGYMVGVHFGELPELCGRRKFGLIKYVMALMNGARLGIVAQSVGISQMAYNEALAYAKDRKQFGQAIINFPAVYEMLSNIKARLDAGRALLYQTARYVNI